MGITFPNETPDYRAARDALLKREVALRREMESVAEDVRALPPGGELREDYLFDGLDDDGHPAKICMSELFRDGTDTLFLYHYMFRAMPRMTAPNPHQDRWRRCRRIKDRALRARRCSISLMAPSRTSRLRVRTSQRSPRRRSTA